MIQDFLVLLFFSAVTCKTTGSRFTIRRLGYWQSSRQFDWRNNGVREDIRDSLAAYFDNCASSLCVHRRFIAKGKDGSDVNPPQSWLQGLPRLLRSMSERMSPPAKTAGQ